MGGKHRRVWRTRGVVVAGDSCTLDDGRADRVAVPRRRPRTLLAIPRGVRCRMRLRHGTQTQGTTDRNDRRVATIRQGQLGGATVQAKPVVLRVPRVRIYE